MTHLRWGNFDGDSFGALSKLDGSSHFRPADIGALRDPCHRMRVHFQSPQLHFVSPQYGGRSISEVHLLRRYSHGAARNRRPHTTHWDGLHLVTIFCHQGLRFRILRPANGNERAVPIIDMPYIYKGGVKAKSGASVSDTTPQLHA